MILDKYGRTWEVLEDYNPNPNDWFVVQIGGTPVFMNNVEGYVLAIEQDGTILKSDI